MADAPLTPDSNWAIRVQNTVDHKYTEYVRTDDSWVPNPPVRIAQWAYEQGFAAALAAAQPPAAPLTDEQIIRAAVAAMPHTNPGVADDLLGGFTMHTEADDIVAIWKAAAGITTHKDAP